MLQLVDVKAGYDKEEILKGISFNADRGQNICIVGPNGCGKSTLLKVIGNLLDYTGSIKIDGIELKSLTRKKLALKIALMSQSNSVYFPYTVYETVALGRYAHLQGVFSSYTKKDEEVILKSISSVGLLDLKDKLISELSGGQLQRVYLARAFAQNPDIILLDEPTNHLDLKCQVEILEYLNKWVKDNNKISIAVLHDLNLVQKYGEYVIMINKGKIELQGTAMEVLNGEVVSDVYNIDIKSFMLDVLKRWEK